MSYFRNSYNNFQEFQRESFYDHRQPELGKEELDLLRELEADDDFWVKPRSQRRNLWDE